MLLAEKVLARFQVDGAINSSLNLQNTQEILAVQLLKKTLPDSETPS